METHYFIPMESLGVTESEESILKISIQGSEEIFTGAKKVTKEEYEQYNNKAMERKEYGNGQLI